VPEIGRFGRTTAARPAGGAAVGTGTVGGSSTANIIGGVSFRADAGCGKLGAEDGVGGTEGRGFSGRGVKAPLPRIVGNGLVVRRLSWLAGELSGPARDGPDVGGAGITVTGWSRSLVRGNVEGLGVIGPDGRGGVSRTGAALGLA